MDGVIFSLGFFFYKSPDFFGFPFLLGNGSYLLQNPDFPFVLWFFFFPFLSLLLPFYHRAATFFPPSFSIFFC